MMIFPGDYVGPVESGRLLGCSHTWARKLAEAGKLEAVQIGGRVHILRSDVARLAEAQAN